MTIRWAHLLLPVAGAVIAGLVGTVAFWDTSKPSILAALSVMGAGVLVRLARGLPFTNVDQFTVEEARQIAAATKQSVRALLALITVIFGAMVVLIFAAPVASELKASTIDWVSRHGDKALSALICFLLAYVFVRIFAVIKGDMSLVDLQAQFLVRGVERRQAERFEKVQAKSGGELIKTPEGYGAVIQ